MKIGHVKIDRAHFRVHFREHWKISREHWKISCEHSRGSLRGDPLVRFTQKSLNLRGHFRGHLRVHSRGHFRDHFRERVRGSNFAVRMLCAFLNCIGKRLSCAMRSVQHFRGPATTHHPHKGPPFAGGIFQGWCVNCRSVRKEQKTHRP